MYFVKSPKIFDFIYPDLIWRIHTKEKKLYLTFDDGPDKNVTPELLKILNQFNAKATFFCVGKKVEKSSVLLNKIIKEGHSIGNHSYHHLKGKKVATNVFLDDVNLCSTLIPTNLFRPPFGSIKQSQIKLLKDQFKIFMWTVMPGDFDKNISKEKCLNRAIKHTKKGTIIVFHDNNEAKDKVFYTIPRYIEYFQKLGYTFEAL